MTSIHQMDPQKQGSEAKHVEWQALVIKKQYGPISSLGALIRQASGVSSLRRSKKNGNVSLNKTEKKPSLELKWSYPLTIDARSVDNVTPQLLGQLHMVLRHSPRAFNAIDHERLLDLVRVLLANDRLAIRTRKVLGESLRCHDPRAYSAHVPDVVRDFQFPSVLGSFRSCHSELGPAYQYGQENEVNVPGDAPDLVEVAHHLGLKVKRHQAAHQREGYENFKIEPDNSIKTPFWGGLVGEEIVSPILESAKQIRQMQILGQVMSDVGYRKHASCGDHVHVGLANLKPTAVGLGSMDYETFQVRLAGQLAIVFAHAYEYLAAVCVGNDYNAPNWSNGRSSNLSKAEFIAEVVRVGHDPVQSTAGANVGMADHFMRPMIDVVNPKISEVDSSFRHRARNHHWGEGVDYRVDPINDRWLSFNLWSYLSIGTAELRCLTLKGHHYHSVDACTQVLQVELAHEFTELALQMLRANDGDIDPKCPVSIERLVHNFRKKITVELLIMGLTQWDQRRGIQQLIDVIELHSEVLNYSMIKRALSQVPVQSLGRFSGVDRRIKSVYIDVIRKAPNYYDEFTLSVLRSHLLAKQPRVSDQILEWVRSSVFSGEVGRSADPEVVSSGDVVA